MTKVVANIVKLTPDAREFLEIVHFPEIAEIANYIVFFDDGDAQFLEELSYPMVGFTPPHFSMLVTYRDICLEIPAA